MEHEFQYCDLGKVCKCFNGLCQSKSDKERIVEKAGRILDNYTVNKRLSEIKAYDNTTYIHSLEVGLLSIYISHLLGLCDKETYLVGMAGFLHDYGKIKIPIEIINKPGKLDIIERYMVESHTIFGAYTLKKDGFNKSVVDAVYEHHESCSGSERGYPRHLVKEEIHLFGRIVAVADKISAYAQNRTYHKERNIDEAMKFIKTCDDVDREIVKKILISMRKDKNYG